MLYLKRKFLLHRLFEAVTETQTGGGGGGETTTTTGGETTTTTTGQTTTTGGKDGGVGETTTADPSADWAKIVESYSNGDSKKAAALGRYANLNAIIDAQLTVREKFSKGEIKTALPKDATEDQKKVWRSENGIPEAADKYELKLSGDQKLTDADQAVIGKYLLPKAHGVNMNSEQAAAAVEAFRDFQAARTVEIQQKDGKDAEAATNKLTVEWGAGFQANKSKVEGMLSTLPAAVKDRFMGARLSDGTGVFNDPDFMKGMLAWANEINPTGTIVPAGGGSLASSIEDELKGIKELRTSDNRKYLSEPVQKRERELIAARDKAKGGKK